MGSNKLVHDFTVTAKSWLNSRHFILTLQAPEKLPEIYPGQFVEVLVENSATTLLRRPFSIYSVDTEKQLIRLLIQVKGEGTHKLGQLHVGEKANLIYPLGKPFSTPDNENVLLVGGGVGAAPLMFLSQYMNTLGLKPDILLGARTKDDLIDLPLFREQCRNLFITTEDSSEGEKGFVTHHSVFNTMKAPYERIYCCGPDAMMHAVANLAKELQIDCEVSLENYMACGFGVCLCCITPTIHGNLRSCMEGPVFNTKILKWE
jgi:dihydroorotate dehydrogenase electron transfer subunit